MPSTRAKSWMSQSESPGRSGRYREAAVAGDDGGDAVEATRRGVRLERELGVVVGVRIDDARRDHPPVGVELACAGAVDEADLGDASAVDGHVGTPPREPGAVHDDAVADHQVVAGHCAARLEHVLVLGKQAWCRVATFTGWTRSWLARCGEPSSRTTASSTSLPRLVTPMRAFGIDGRDGYFASRSAPMGAVEPNVVIAVFYNFNPDLITHALPAAWSKASPAAVVKARFDAVDKALRRVLGDEVESASVARAAELCAIATEACALAGRPLAAAHASLAWPAQPHVALWHAISVLREFRGDGHIACLVGAGIDPVEALVLHAAMAEVPRVALQTTRAWSDEAWDAAVERLRERGLVDDDGGFTEEGDAFRQAIEDRTDLLAMAPWLHLGEAGCDELRALVRPLSKAVVAGTDFS